MPSNQYPLIAREGWPLLAILAILVVITKLYIGFLSALCLSLVLALTVFLLRDPDRTVPALPLAIVSPVHGTVTAVDEVEDPKLSRKSGRVRLKMSLTDIYSLRSPIEGKIMKQWTTRSNGLLQLDYWIRTDEEDDVVLSISFRKYLKFFHIYLQSGERIGQGQRCGYICFGATVEVYVPVNTRIAVRNGDRVVSGSSVLGSLVHSSAPGIVVSPGLTAA